MSGKNTSNLRKELFTVPNILVYIRILLIPFYTVFYAQGKYGIALILLAIAFFTDFLDGKIARMFNCVTDVGKTIDPIADKLCQFSIALCLMFKYPLMISVAAVLFVKEISMGIMGLVLLDKGGKVFGAMWYGKCSTAFVDLTMVLLLVAPVFGIGISDMFANVLIIACDAILIVVSVLYTRLFSVKIKELTK
ncbi:MAG: CDP-alcohol phosphatidyltransferase family protein [Clostridia bacterium]|nr:CDP-alcohol phosphatidyltransferase family protein [Clostridia bacterium]